VVSRGWRDGQWLGDGLRVRSRERPQSQARLHQAIAATQDGTAGMHQAITVTQEGHASLQQAIAATQDGQTKETL